MFPKWIQTIVATCCPLPHWFFLIGIHGVTWLRSVTWWGQLYHYDFVEIGTSNYHTFTQARLNHTFQYMCESFKRPWRAILSCRCDKLQICLKAFEVGLLIFGSSPKATCSTMLSSLHCRLECFFNDVFMMLLHSTFNYLLSHNLYIWQDPHPSSKLSCELWQPRGIMNNLEAAGSHPSYKPCAYKCPGWTS